MRKLKSLRGKTRRKTGFVEFEDGFALPIKTLSIAEEVTFTFNEYLNIPVVQRRATAEEVEELKKTDPSFNSKIIPFIKVYDKTNPEFEHDTVEIQRLSQIANTAKYIDMDYIVESEEGTPVTLWEDFGIAKGDYYELAKYLAYDMCLSTMDLERILVEVKALQGESIYEKLARFEQLTGRDMIKILNYVHEGIARENAAMADLVEKGTKAEAEAEKLNRQYGEEEE
jgi:hypothetical protein